MSIFQVAQGERALAVEMLAGSSLIFLDNIGQEKLPSPTVLVGSLTAYGFLAFMAMFGERISQVASLFGALVLLAIAIRHAPSLFGKIPLKQVKLDQT